VVSNQTVPVLHARFHCRRHTPQMPMLTTESTVNLNVP